MVPQMVLVIKRVTTTGFPPFRSHWFSLYLLNRGPITIWVRDSYDNPQHHAAYIGAAPFRWALSKVH